jgi:integral membrane sensor domain MASE1
MAQVEKPEVGFTYKLVTTAVTAGINAVLALFAIILIPIPGLPSASGFWIPAGFYFVLTMWFGVWAALGALIATFIAMGYFSGFTLHILLDGAVGDFLAPMVAAILFKKVFKASPLLESQKDWIAWLVSVPIASVICGLWVHSVNLAFGAITAAFWIIGVAAYGIGDTLAVYIIGTPLLKRLTSYVQTSPVYTEGLS